MLYHRIKGILIVALAATLTVSCCMAQDIRQNPTNQTNARLQKTPSSNETCGGVNDLAKKAEICAKPLMDLLEGRVEKWPRDDNDVNNLCNSFIGSEKCIRDVGRRCAKGLQRTILSTVANSIKRARQRECIKPKYPGVLKMTQCIEKHNFAVKALIANATSRLFVVDKQMPDLVEKTNSVCCMVREIEDNIKSTMGPRCPEEAKVIVSLYRAILEDVIELICRTPKCKDLFKGYSITKIVTKDGIIAVLLRIVFSLG